MNRILSIPFILIALTLLMGTQCNKFEDIELAKQGFAEKINLSPEQKTYSISDTVWLSFQTASKTLFDTISNQRLSSNSIKFLFETTLLAKYDYPTISSGSFCDYVLLTNITPTTYNSNNSSSISFEVGCDNASHYDIKFGIVLKYKGYYVLDMSLAPKVQACSGQTNPYPSSYIRFTYNVNDTNKDIYLSIPPSARNEYPDGATERQLEFKTAYAFKVQ